MIGTEIVVQLVERACPWLAGGIAFVCLVHTLMGLRLIRVLVTRQPNRGPMILDRAMVVLCLRGDDPYLEQTIRAASQLEYDNYLLKIVVDHEQDPAMATVRRVLGGIHRSGVILEVLENRHSSCSLKCSALLQALSEIPHDVRYIALLDADVVPHASWLNDLIGPLIDPDVAVTTGNRWYSPNVPSIGSIMRYMWNAGAVSQMFANNIPWGGSMAFKTSLVHETDLRQLLQYAFCEDTLIGQVAIRIGRRVRLVPQAIMVNREDCRLSNFFEWLSRQLLLVRLYHSGWKAVLFVGAISFASFLVAFGVMFVAAVTGADKAFMSLWLVTMTAIVVLAAEVATLEFAVRRIAKNRVAAVSRWSLKAMLYGTWAFLTVPLLYSLALLRAGWLQDVRWRGIDYRIDGPFQVEMKNYQPFGASEASEQTDSHHVVMAHRPIFLTTSRPISSPTMQESIY